MILCAGRLLPEKDFPTLVRAFAELRRSTTCRLVILGEGPEAQNLVDLAKQLGVADDFALPGYAANIYAWMKQAAVFVLSSKWEGLSNVLVEAMSVGTPVISTDVAGPREVLEGGRWGRLTPPGDAEALAAAMRDTIGNPPAPASAECLARFDYLEVGRRYLALINSTLAARG